MRSSIRERDSKRVGCLVNQHLKLQFVVNDSNQAVRDNSDINLDANYVLDFPHNFLILDTASPH